MPPVAQFDIWHASKAKSHMPCLITIITAIPVIINKSNERSQPNRNRGLKGLRCNHKNFGPQLNKLLSKGKHFRYATGIIELTNLTFTFPNLTKQVQEKKHLNYNILSQFRTKLLQYR